MFKDREKKLNKEDSETTRSSKRKWKKIRNVHKIIKFKSNK